MNYWRMFLNAGTGGEKMWPDCRRLGIAAIGYWDSAGKLVVEDCSKIDHDEYEDIWRQKDPHNSNARSSLRKLAYEMMPGDTIYAAEGGKIVGCGRIIAPYKYDLNILKGTAREWPHYVKVKWDKDFRERKNPDNRRSTVLEWKNSDLRKFGLREARGLQKNRKKSTNNIVAIIEAEEGKEIVKEILWRSRNRKLIEEKKSHSDYRCEVCGMKFEDVYGEIGKEYIVAHHLDPIGKREVASRTTLAGIALVCSDCHAMLHKKRHPYTIQALRNRVTNKILLMRGK